MQALYTILTVLVALTILTGLFFSFRYRARQKSEADHGVSPNVQKNPILLNPVFWAFILFLAIALGWVWLNKLYYRAPF
jgi:Trk-type K+ transport system membrane component